MSIESALWWILFNLVSTTILGFYSMQEMACVSFNRIRLHYYVSKGMQPAIWLNYLLQNPARLFGTTLISVNCAMFIGSECARETYIALGLNPDFAPITQVVLVVVFAELAPMFAARHYAERVAMFGAPILYATAKLLTPILWSIAQISKFADYLTGKKEIHSHVVLNQDDLQQILDEQDESGIIEGPSGEDVNTIARNIFNLRGKDALHVMEPIASVPMLPSNATVAQAQQLLQTTELTYIPVYHRDRTHVVGVIHPRDLIRIPLTRRVRDYAQSPWFITQHTKAMQILKEFRRNHYSIAIVLNEQGLATGVLSLDNLTEEIFGKVQALPRPQKASGVIIDRTFPGEMKVADFNAQFDVVLDTDGNITLAELMTQILGHYPEVGESIIISPFELTVKETSLLEIKKIAITTRIE
jgi:CBS domain containing-hemolysin-like protein